MQLPGRPARVPILTGAVVADEVKSTAAAEPLDRSGPRTVIPPFTVSCAFAGAKSANNARISNTYTLLIYKCVLRICHASDRSRFRIKHLIGIFGFPASRRPAI